MRAPHMFRGRIQSSLVMRLVTTSDRGAEQEHLCALREVDFVQELSSARIHLRFSSPQAGSRSIGHVMQRGPPRPRPSSPPATVTTSMPCLRSIVFVATLRS